MRLAKTTAMRSGHTATRARARATAAPVVVGALVSFLFVLLMVGGFHQPQPHGLPVALAAPSAIAAQVETRLAEQAPGAFSVRSYPSVAAAEGAVVDGDAVGGLAVASGSATIVTAGAQGPATGQAVAGAFGAIAQAARLPARTVDVKPLPAEDSFGLTGFLLVVGLTIASAVFAAVTFATGHSLDPRKLLAVVAGFALLAGGAATLAADTTIGAVDHFWAVAGIAALLALAVGGTMLALARLLGAPGLGLGALVVVLTSISTSGSVVGWRFESAFHRALSQWLPAGSAVEALRDVLYFDGAHAAGRLAVLAVWALAALTLLSITDTIRAHTRPHAAIAL